MSISIMRMVITGYHSKPCDDHAPIAWD